MTKKKLRENIHRNTFFTIHKKTILLTTFIILVVIWQTVLNSPNESSTPITNNQKTTYTDNYAPDKDIDINETLSYETPAGWANISDNNYSIILRNGELKKSGNGPFYLDGADIVIYVNRNIHNLNAKEILSDYAQNNFRNTPNTQDVSRNGLSGAYQRIKFDGTTDYYIFANKFYYWRISFNCDSPCPQELISDKNTLLDSLTAK